MIPPPADGGASMSVHQMFMQMLTRVGTAWAGVRRLTLRTGPGLRAAGHRQVVG